MKKSLLFTLMILALLAGYSFFADLPHHAHEAWQKIPGFYGLLGVGGALVLMGLAKGIGGKLLYRPENYYGEDEA